ncbi:hypothetical protein RvY_07406 [Ramazzottius varieornatus]|uniref:NADH dehydrogenase [ubiquinone] 1 beta subcomplex subunit 4 n=1 Tax=Ramazzottius varieornatus TaxID=947166 RepID=A0A1D1V562_RAMVA|nr:hypothetical protein RvY_07406 [Ramazzottius varieornatus]
MSGGSGPPAVRNWSLPEQYNLSDHELRKVEQRAERRWALKQEYQRILFNPYNSIKAEGGTPFDPAIQRFTSTRADYYHYFKPNRKNFTVFACVYLIPVATWCWYIHRKAFAFDQKVRRGEIPWRYRMKTI